MTVGLPTTENLANVYASADAQAITTYFSHKTVEKALSSGLDAARDALQTKIVEILTNYKNTLGGSSGGLSKRLRFTSSFHPLTCCSTARQFAYTSSCVPWHYQKCRIEKICTNTFCKYYADVVFVRSLC
jgi:hypothetical protein